MGKSTISMAIFHCYVSSAEGSLKGSKRTMNTESTERAFVTSPGPEQLLESYDDADVEESYDHIIWVNYNDLTATEPWNHGLVREIIPKWP